MVFLAVFQKSKERKIREGPLPDPSLSKTLCEYLQGQDLDSSTEERSAPECTKIAHHHWLAIFTADLGIAGNSAVEISFVRSNRKDNRRSLVIFVASLGASKLAILRPN